ncbi:MAG: flippase-like domain-containing protein [Deltaproteobacteria bacterium]|jgi:uncharacterized protein (TIRG00374 family)
MKRFHIYTLILGVLLLGFLIWEIGLRTLYDNLIRLGWGLAILILAEGAVDLFHTAGWRHCLSGPYRSLSFLRLYGIHLAGFSINYLTPTATLGGEVTKGTLLAMNHRGPEAATGVIIGKLSYALAQLVFVVLGSFLILWGINLPAGALAAMLTGTVLLGAGILGFLAVQKWGKLGSIVRWLAAHRIGGKALGKVSESITRVDDDLKLFYRNQPLDLPLSIVWHMAGMACSIGQTWFFLFIMAGNASLHTASAIWLLGTWMDLLTFPIPLDIGVREGTRILAFKAVGLESALGLTYGLATRLKETFWAGVGLLIYAAFLAEKRPKGVLAQMSKERRR